MTVATLSLELMYYGWTGSPDYAIGIYHFSTSSQENSTCVVEPGTPEDLGKVVRSSRPAMSAAVTNASTPDNQLKLVGMTKTKFGVGNRSPLVIACQGQASDSIPHTAGEEWWSQHQSRVLFDRRSPNLHREVQPSDLRRSIEYRCGRDRPHLGYRVRTTPVL